MQNRNIYNQQGSNYYQNPSNNYPNQMSNYQQPPQGQRSNYGQQPPYGQQNPQQNPYAPSIYGVPQGCMPPQQFSCMDIPNQTDIPFFKLIGRGTGIDEREYGVITHAAAEALNIKEDPLSNGIIKRIKQQIGGEWMVFASVEGMSGYDFSLSIVTGNDFLSFTIQNFRFQVCRLR